MIMQHITIPARCTPGNGRKLSDVVDSKLPVKYSYKVFIKGKINRVHPINIQSLSLFFTAFVTIE